MPRNRAFGRTTSHFQSNAGKGQRGGIDGGITRLVDDVHDNNQRIPARFSRQITSSSVQPNVLGIIYIYLPKYVSEIFFFVFDFDFFFSFLSFFFIYSFFFFFGISFFFLRAENMFLWEHNKFIEELSISSLYVTSNSNLFYWILLNFANWSFIICGSLIFFSIFLSVNISL